jgi:hypothetical protein
MQPIPGRDEPQRNIPPQGLPELCKAPVGSPYSDDEWKLLTMTPLQVGKTMIVTSSPNPIGAVQEVRALNNTLNEALGQHATNPLLKEIGETLKRVVDLGVSGQVQQIKESMVGQKVDQQTARSTALASCQQAVSILQKAPPQDAMTYKEMVYLVARKVAEAAREGGFLGIAGGQTISPSEQALLNDLASTLGMQRS